MDYKYYEITVDAGTCNTSRIVRTTKGIKAIEEHVTHDKLLVSIKDFSARLLKCVEVTEEKYTQFINLFVESDREKVIAGTTI